MTWEGTQGDGASSAPSVSADGMLAAFVSAASTFDGDDTNGVADIYVHARDWGDTWRVSLDPDYGDPDAASSSPSVSADGQYVAFVSAASNLVADDTNTHPDAFVRDLDRWGISRWSLTAAGVESTGVTSAPILSADASVVAFVSTAPDIVVGDGNGASDVFVRVPE